MIRISFFVSFAAQLAERDIGRVSMLLTLYLALFAGLCTAAADRPITFCRFRAYQAAGDLCAMERQEVAASRLLSTAFSGEHVTTTHCHRFLNCARFAEWAVRPLESRLRRACF
jgi:hypothetical protein